MATGTGGLRELIYEPAAGLMDVFRRRNARFVAFVEVAELERIEACGTDPTIDLVKRQVRELHADGFEIGLHLHPQWCNARYEAGQWHLDDREYNLCTLPRERITDIVGDALAYLRRVLRQPSFTPLSFRAGNWLFQPTAVAADVLAYHGLRIDSSVFKGGRQRQHAMDYRRALRNGHYWSFRHDVNEPDPAGSWTELPIHTEMVPCWRMLTAKRVRLQTRKHVRPQTRQRGPGRAVGSRLHRVVDFMRPRYPLKLDVCRMGLAELTGMMDRLIREDRKHPEIYHPVVAIGHTKDLVDLPTVDAFLAFLAANDITVSTFHGVAEHLNGVLAVSGGHSAKRGARPTKDPIWINRRC
jgi:hypothetical protein